MLKELKSITSALQKNHEEIELSNDVSQQFSFLLLYNFVYGHTRKITGGNRENFYQPTQLVIISFTVIVFFREIAKRV